MTEHELYEEAIKGMENKARHKLANYLAHSYLITKTGEMTLIERKKDKMALILDKEGNLWIAKRAI